MVLLDHKFQVGAIDAVRCDGGGGDPLQKLNLNVVRSRRRLRVIARIAGTIIRANYGRGTIITTLGSISLSLALPATLSVALMDRELLVGPLGYVLAVIIAGILRAWMNSTETLLRLGDPSQAHLAVRVTAGVAHNHSGRCVGIVCLCRPPLAQAPCCW